MLTTWPAGLPVTQQIPLPLRVMGFTLAVSSPLWLWALFHASNLYFSYTTNSGPLLVLLIAAANIPLLLHVTRSDPYLRAVMAVGMLAKLAAASLYLYMVFHIYEAASDSLMYFSQGQIYAYDVNSIGRWQLLQPFWSNNFINMLSGALQVFLGSSIQALTVLFAMASFWGDYLFYRAFCETSPNGDHRLAAAFFFLLPSIIFWPACIGKDAVIAASGRTLLASASPTDHEEPGQGDEPIQPGLHRRPGEDVEQRSEDDRRGHLELDPAGQGQIGERPASGCIQGDEDHGDGHDGIDRWDVDDERG